MQFSLGSNGCERELSCMVMETCVGRGIKVVSSVYTPSFLAPILSLRRYYASCRLNFLHPRIAFIRFGIRFVVLHLP